MDEAREARRKHVEPETPFFERARFEVLDEHIGVLEQTQQELASRRVGEIDRHAALVAVHANEVRRGLAEERRTPAAGFVALRRLDLHYLGAVVTEDLCAVGTSEHAREVDDSDAGEALFRALSMVCRSFNRAARRTSSRCRSTFRPPLS